MTHFFNLHQLYGLYHQPYGATYTIDEQYVVNYSKHIVEPNVSYQPLAVTGWTKHTPNNNLNIPVNGSSIVIFKKGNNIYVWTESSLEEKAEIKEAIHLSFKNASGAGNPEFSQLSFHYGQNPIFSHDGQVIISSESITFSKTSDWSLVWLGTYTPESINVTPGSITNTYNAPVPPTTTTEAPATTTTTEAPATTTEETAETTTTTAGDTTTTTTEAPVIETVTTEEQVAPHIPPVILAEKLVKEENFAKAGDELNYYFTVKNDGIVPVVKLTVNDSLLGIEDLAIDLTDDPLMPDGSYTYEFPKAYLVTAADLDVGEVVNVLTVIAETAEGARSEAEANVATPWIQEQILPQPPDLPQTGEYTGYRGGIYSLLLGGAVVLIAINRRRKITYETDQAD